jgi:hypothetical protein
MLHADQTTHLILNALRHTAVLDISVDVNVTEAEDAVKMFIFTEARKEAVRLVKIESRWHLLRQFLEMKAETCVIAEVRARGKNHRQSTDLWPVRHVDQRTNVGSQ